MNYSHESPQAIQQSDAIVRKLNQIKNAIGGNSEPHHQHSHSHQHNLNDYLPKDRLNSSAHYEANSHSYRRSLENKLERLFREERAGFSENVSFLQNQPQSVQLPKGASSRHMNADAFTIDRMEMKIQQLQRKYLQQQQYTKPKNATIKEKGDWVKPPSKNRTAEIKSTMMKQADSQKKRRKRSKGKCFQLSECPGERKLLKEVECLKEEVHYMKKNNEDLADKLQTKVQNRKYKKQRSKFLLNCILEKLQEIQRQIERRKRLGRYVKAQKRLESQQHEEEPNLAQQNSKLMKQVECLKNRLKKISAQKEIAEQRSQWIESQIRKLNEM